MKIRLKRYFELPGVERSQLRWAFGLIAISKVLLPILGLRRLMSILEKMTAPRNRSSIVSAKRLAEIVAIAGARVRGSACLDQSLALQALLRRQSIPARLVVGVNCEAGFTAHAWVELGVELGGEVVAIPHHHLHPERDFVPLFADHE